MVVHGGDLTPAELGAELLEVLKQDRDAFIPVCGPVRIGKSTLTVQTAKAINQEPPFSLKEDVAYAEQDVFQNLAAASPFRARVMDEAVYALYVGDTSTAPSKELLKMMATIGFRNLACFACIPNFLHLNRKFRNDRVGARIEVMERGVAVLLKRSRDRYAEDPWRMDEEKEAVGEYLREEGYGDPDEAPAPVWTQAVASSPLAVKVIRFQQLPKKEEAEYRRFKEAALAAAWGGNGDAKPKLTPKQERQREAAWKGVLALRGLGWTYKQIGELLGVTDVTARTWIEEKSGEETPILPLSGILGPGGAASAISLTQAGEGP